MAAPDDRVFLAVLSNHRRLEDVLAGLAACGVGHSVCLDLVVQGLRRLLGLTDPRARPVVDFVLHAFLDGVFPDELTTRASERPELDRSTHPVLIDLYEQLEQQPIVSELRA
jgi:hypothetical protein